MDAACCHRSEALFCDAPELAPGGFAEIRMPDCLYQLEGLCSISFFRQLLQKRISIP